MITYRDQDQLERAYHTLLGRVSQDTHDEPPPAQEAMPCLRIFSGELAYSPSFDELLQTYLRNYTGRGIPKSNPVSALSIEVMLPPAQAQRGGHLPIRVPVFHVCPQCAGTGRAGFFTCDECQGQGMTEEFRTIEVLLPAGLEEETLIPISLRPMGVGNLYLNLRIRPLAAVSHG